MLVPVTRYVEAAVLSVVERKAAAAGASARAQTVIKLQNNNRNVISEICVYIKDKLRWYYHPKYRAYNSDILQVPSAM